MNSSIPYTHKLKRNLKKILPHKFLDTYRGIKNKKKPISLYFNGTYSKIDIENNRTDNILSVFYWDDKPNFGDTIGPFLLSKIYGKPILNIYHLKLPGIMAVGSILQFIDRRNMVVWGSGLIEIPSTQDIENIKKYEPKILSVRGGLTASYLKENGIQVPESSVYGDPALLLPLFYDPKPRNHAHISVCPHYIHKPLFLDNLKSSTLYKVIDVQDSMQNVIDSIYSSKVCISTSLHGLIIAQAYGIPWVWLEITDMNLTGNDFKFKDFFSTLDIKCIPRYQISLNELDSLDIIEVSKLAQLPPKLYDEEKILNCLKDYLDY